jgi:hypothetical protein
MKKAFVYIICTLPAIQAFTWSVLSGLIGTLILAGFFYTIMSLELLSFLLPLIAGINASISGYMLIERAENEFRHTNLVSLAAGVVVALFSFIAINGFCYKMGGFILMSGLQALVTSGICAIGAWSAGALAVKYRKLKEQAAGS